MTTKQTSFLHFINAWQQRECTNVHTLHAGTIIASQDVFIFATPREQNITSDDFFRTERFMFLTIIDCITVTMHLIDGIRRRIVSTFQLLQLCYILCFKVLIQFLVIYYAILGIIKISQHNLARSFTNVEHNVRTLLGSGSIDTHSVFIIATPSVEGVLVMKCYHITLMSL